MIMPSPEQFPLPAAVDPQHLRIFLCQPPGSGTGRRREYYGNAVLIQMIDDFLHPVKPIDSLLRFQKRPGKNSQRNGIDSRLLKTLCILLQNLRMIQPLLRIVISAMEQFPGTFLHHCSPFFLSVRSFFVRLQPSACGTAASDLLTEMVPCFPYHFNGFSDRRRQESPGPNGTDKGGQKPSAAHLLRRRDRFRPPFLSFLSVFP